MFGAQLNPQAVKLLMDESQKGNPAATKALQEAGGPAFMQSITPPPTDAQINVSPATPPPPAQGMPVGPARELSGQGLPPSPPIGQTMTGAPTAPAAPAPKQEVTNQENKGSGDHSMRNNLLAVGGGLLGAGIAKMFGGGDAAGQFMTGYAAPTVEGMQQRQNMENQRSQKVWADQWEQVQSLPPEVLSDPKFAELAQSVQAMQKDMETGNVGNLKTAGAFMMARAKFSKDLDDIQSKIAIGREIDKANLLMDAQHQNNQKRLADALAKVDNPQSTPEERTAAAAFLNHEGAARPREVTDETGQRTTKMLTDQEYNQWGINIQKLKNEQANLEADNKRADALAADTRAYHQSSLANERKGLEIRQQEVGERQDQRNSRRQAVGAMSQVESRVNSTLAAMESDPQMQAVPAQQRKAMAIQKVLEDSVTQQELTRAAGVEFMQNTNGQTGVRINGRVYPFDKRNPKANKEAMHALIGMLTSNSRLGEME